MTPNSLIILNFHGVGPLTRKVDAGELDCWLEPGFLEAVLDLAKARPWVRITVDDGNASDLDLMVPALKRRGLRATFFVCSGRVNKPTFLNESQVRELRALGMPVGSHGALHRSWRRLGPAERQAEIADSRRLLGDILGEPVESAACPFGEYDRGVLKSLRAAGYRTVFTSDGGRAADGAWLRPRTTVRRSTDLGYIEGLVEHGEGPLRQAAARMRTLVKSLRP